MAEQLGILIVEDSRTQAQQLQGTLEAEGYRVSVALDGPGALAILATDQSVRLIISDIVMPGMDGYELCRRIKDDARLREVPVILLTALSQTEDVIRGLESGADNFITKPYDLSYLLTRIRSILLSRELYARDRAQLGLEIHFGGKPHYINSDRLQILNLLLSTYDNAVRVNRALVDTQGQLERLNARLESQVAERTSALTEEIAERKGVESSLRESERRYRDFFENDVTADFIAGPDGRILDCNPAFVRVFGFDRPEDASGVAMETLFASPGECQVLLEQMGLEGRIEGREIACRRVDGAPLYVVGNILGRGTQGGELYKVFGYLMDVTDKKKLEQMLVQAQKMEAIGRLAGGIAHDFNNMLMVIQGFSDVLSRKLQDRAQLHCVDEIRKATERAASLTQQLLAFSRKQVLQVEVLSLNAVIRDAAKMIGRLIGEDVQPELSLAEDLRPVRADRSQLVQILLNLAANARDAMPKGGRFTIRTANEVLTEEHRAEHPEVRPGPYAVMRVHDTGVGMDRQTQEHLFEPFFTTKEQGKGTGLGLATVYGIVEQSGGYVRCSSAPGQGTEFSVFLPAIGQEIESRADEAAETGASSGGESILLVEDDHKVREMLREVLSEAGYSVQEASNGRVALGIIQSAAPEVDLIVTDVVMPLLTGVEMAAEVRKMRPEMRIVFMSGYIDGRGQDPSKLMEGECFLQKPVTPQLLLATVRRVLDRNT